MADKHILPCRSERIHTEHTEQSRMLHVKMHRDVIHLVCRYLMNVFFLKTLLYIQSPFGTKLLLGEQPPLIQESFPLDFARYLCKSDQIRPQCKPLKLFHSKLIKLCLHGSHFVHRDIFLQHTETFQMTVGFQLCGSSVGRALLQV